MILQVGADDFVIVGGVRYFNSKRPNCCCGAEKVWAHGWVERSIDDQERCRLRRYRCPKCRTMFQDRPSSHWPFLRFGIVVIFHSLFDRLRNGRWPRTTPRQRGGHWLRRLRDLCGSQSIGTNPLVHLCELNKQNLPFIWLTERAKKAGLFHPT